MEKETCKIESCKNIVRKGKNYCRHHKADGTKRPIPPSTLRWQARRRLNQIETAKSNSPILGFLAEKSFCLAFYLLRKSR